MGDIYSQVRSGGKNQESRSKARVDSEVQIMQSAISNLKVEMGNIYVVYFCICVILDDGLDGDAWIVLPFYYNPSTVKCTISLSSTVKSQCHHETHFSCIFPLLNYFLTPFLSTTVSHG